MCRSTWGRITRFCRSSARKTAGLFKPHLFVVETPALQHFHCGIAYASEEPASDGPNSKNVAERFAPFFKRRVFRGGLSWCSVERTCLGVPDQNSFREFAKLRANPSAFFDDVKRKSRLG